MCRPCCPGSRKLTCRTSRILSSPCRQPRQSTSLAAVAVYRFVSFDTFHFIWTASGCFQVAPPSDGGYVAVVVVSVFVSIVAAVLVRGQHSLETVGMSNKVVKRTVILVLNPYIISWAFYYFLSDIVIRSIFSIIGKCCIGSPLENRLCKKQMISELEENTTWGMRKDCSDSWPSSSGCSSERK